MSSHYPRQPQSQSQRQQPYNIIPIHDLLADHPSLSFPEVQAAQSALRTVGNLRKPPNDQWAPHYDLLDWLGLFFGFQPDNIRNQREHLVLCLANSQMSLHPPPDNINCLDHTVLRRFRLKLLKNYTLWCRYFGCPSNVCIAENCHRNDDLRCELLYVSLYLLIWGEAANLRFAPECLSYIFLHMAFELNKILFDFVDENTAMPYTPTIIGENAFLNKIVKPIYESISKEVANSANGTSPHSAWRNYDDINEVFWSRSCFDKLKWPIDTKSTFFEIQKGKGHVDKTGFVEQRSFWNLYRSFDRLWIMLVLFLQACIIVAWEQEINKRGYPWHCLTHRDVQVKCLTVFLTWSVMRFLQSVLDIGMQYSLISKETMMVGVRMFLKCVTAAVWVILFGTFYARIWTERNRSRDWAGAPERQIVSFLVAMAVFALPEALSLVLFIIPWARNFIERSDWKIFYICTWWIQTRIFVGRGMREGIADNIKYSLFWILVLATKFTFSYFLQIKPMMRPTSILLKLNDVDYEWYEFFSCSNRFAVGLLWLPVVLIYLLDIQIWYSIYSSFVGAIVGLLSHLGEIRNMQQLRLRFQFFASAVQFNLMAEEQLLDSCGIKNTFFHKIKKNLKDSYHRIMLIQGIARPYTILESSQLQANKFTCVWNEVVNIFREEDIISDKEVELLELPQNTWNVRVIRWPCILLSNELLLALGHAKELVNAPDRRLWRKICKNEYRRCAVIEAYDCVKYLLLAIITQGTTEHSILKALFQGIDDAIENEKFTETYNVSALKKIHKKLGALVEMLIHPKKVDPNNVVNSLQSLYETTTRNFLINKKHVMNLRKDGLAPSFVSGRTMTRLFENVVVLPCEENEHFYKQLRRLHIILNSKKAMHDVPKNLEARRRIAFFSNSVFMNMPHAPQVKKMLAFSVLTPYYSEEVVYSKEHLQKENEDGVSILFYLQTLYNDEWNNFIERMRREGMANDEEVWDYKLRDLRLWASYRGQTLARTVRGMMYYHRALKMLAFLDSKSEMDIRYGGLDLPTVRQSSLSPANRSISQLYKGQEHGTALMKYSYVIACQIYGTQKKEKKPEAEEILQLLKYNEALRVAYVDEVPVAREQKDYYSVLVKYDQQLERDVEIYRIKLPGPIKLGEGKPENQNSSVIFTRGDAVQAIDMNQDNYFEEALKMRNLLEQFRYYHGIRKPTILGVREHIFTSGVSTVARFMSAQEKSFVTLGQRVLASILKVRMHYGHPDVFDRFWFLTRGGVSKASKVINISEDIFAGFNCTLRGGSVGHYEYIQVGKGRDVGLNQISMFEAKVASGNGEQVLSRDVYRLGHRLSFFRMLSFFYSTVGFCFNTMLVVLTVYAFLWGRLHLALSGIEASVESNRINNNAALGAILNQQFIIQMSLFTALPMMVENYLEFGFLNSIWDFITMQLQLSSIFFTFSLGTRAHYFGRTILHGGAKYRATDRGFVVQHISFTENYRLYSRSHFVKAIELGLILTVYAIFSPVAKGTFVYIALTISSWFLVISWLLAPFLFNPLGFAWSKTVNDFREFMNWMGYRGGVFVKSEQSWEAWWMEEQDHLRITGWSGRILEVIVDLRFLFFQYGIVYQLGIAAGNNSIVVYLLSWVYILVAFIVYFLISYAHHKYSVKDHLYYRLIQFLVILLVVLVIVALLIYTHLQFVDLFTSLLAFVPTGWGLISIALVFRRFLQNTLVWNCVTAMARLYEIMFGVIVMAPVAFLSWMPGFQLMQTRILFNDDFHRGLRIFQILTSKKRA